MGTFKVPNLRVDDLALGGGTTLGQFNPFQTESKTAEVLRKVSESVDHLANNPAELHYIAEELVLMLQINVNDPSTLNVIASIIVKKAIKTSNLAYTGAGLCHQLMASGLQVEDTRFEHILLNYCNKLFAKLVTKYKFQEGEPQVLEEIRCFTRFFAEMFLYLKVDNREQVDAYTVVGLGIEELLKYFCGTKSDDNILFVSQILKLIGWQLENANDEDGMLKGKLDSIFRALRNQKASGCISYDSMVILEELEQLRRRGWDHVDESNASVVANLDEGAEDPPESPDHIYELPYNYYLESLSYYNFEERDEEGIYLDDEPPFVEAAYDEFVADLKVKRRNRLAQQPGTSTPRGSFGGPGSGSGA